MLAKYIIRLDDACPTMHKANWDRMERLLFKYNISPVVAVIPDCRDEKLNIDEPDTSFWERVRRWQSSGWDIALHGNTHVYTSTEPGLVPLSTKSEFSGLCLEEQKKKIREGTRIFARENIQAEIWIAPSHSFDKNTLAALSSESKIRLISDGISLFPFRKDDFIWVPQQIWHFRKMFFGCWTGCFHPNTMKNADFEALEKFIMRNKNKFVRISDYRNCCSRRGVMDYIFEQIFWFLKNLKK